MPQQRRNQPFRGLSERDLGHIEQELAPFMTSRSVNREAMDLAQQTAEEIYGEPEVVTRDEREALRDMEARARQLQPAERLPHKSMGTAGQNNLYATDTRGVMTGLANAGIARINRRREQELYGDPERQEEMEEKAEKTARSAAEDFGAIDEDAEGLSRLQNAFHRIRGGLRSRRADRYADESERVEGFAGEMEDIRSRIERGEAREEDMAEFVRNFAPDVYKRVYDATTDAERDQRRHGQRMDEIEARGEQERMTAEHAADLQQGGQRGRDLAYSEARDIIESRFPKADTLKIQLQNLYRQYNNMDGSEDNYDEVEQQIRETAREFEQVKKRIHNKWLKLNPDIANVLGEQDTMPIIEEAAGEETQEDTNRLTRPPHSDPDMSERPNPHEKFRETQQTIIGNETLGRFNPDRMQ